MSQIFSLDNRLSACASLVRKNARLADIGTDHAYLPVWLCLSGKSVGAIAADIKASRCCVAKKLLKNITHKRLFQQG